MPSCIMQFVNRISTVFFDLDNTLHDYWSADLAALTVLKERYFPHEKLETFYKAWSASNKKNWALYEAGQLTMDEQRQHRIQEVWHTFDKTVTPAEALEIFDYYVSIYEQSWRLFPHVIDVLAELTEKQIPLGIITNGSSQPQRKKLLDLKLQPFFQEHLIVISDEVGFFKPEAEIFLKAQALANARPENILYIGDLFTHDVEPARKLKWNALLIDHTGANPETDKITDLRDILKLHF